MSAQAAGKVASAAGKAAGNSVNSRGLTKGAKRDPELYALFTVMSSAFGLVGYYFGRKPTSTVSESTVSTASSSMPWEAEHSRVGDAKSHFKYKYHPGGDPKNTSKDAPSALHSVIVPNVNLPKELHDQFNKWGKDEY